MQGSRRGVDRQDCRLGILVVDDYQTMVRIIRNLLKQIGYENVDEAANGQAALEMIRRSATASSSPTGTWSR
jgi:CheY-like chemotaxis protein